MKVGPLFFLADDSEKSRDNVAIAAIDLDPENTLKVNGFSFQILEKIPEGGSFSITEIPIGGPLISYGICFGYASKHIPPGSVVDNTSLRDKQDLVHQEVVDRIYSIDNRTTSEIKMPDHFLGFLNFEKYGKPIYGIENNVVIVGMVDCVGAFCKNLASYTRKNSLHLFPQVTDLFPIVPGSGCGMPSGAPREELKKIFVSILNHPNITHALLVGLGCEQISTNTDFTNNDLNFFKNNVIDFDRRVVIEKLQNYSSEEEALEKISNHTIPKILQSASEKKRVQVPINYLTIGVKCGGSDRFSGIMSNKILGKVADLTIENQGSVIISETPEFEGLFPSLAARATNSDLKKWVLDLEKRFEMTSLSYPIAGPGKQEIAPGNKQGGLINAKLKSAGAMMKAGSSQLVGGLEYLDYVWDKNEKGLYLLNGPSYDPISTSALFLAGAQIVLFSTGRGTSLSNALGPVIKISNKKDTGLKFHCDFHCQSLFEGQPISYLVQDFYNLIINVCSGQRFTKARELSEKMFKLTGNISHRDFQIWKRWGEN